MSGFSGVHAGSDVVVGLHFQVEANLSVQFAIQTLLEQQRPEARREDAESAHNNSSRASCRPLTRIAALPWG